MTRPALAATAAPACAAKDGMQAADRPARAQDAGTVLAFDFGLKRIGVAVGDAALRIAHPLAAIEFDDNARRHATIDALVAEWRPVLFVIGAPVRDDGSEHPLAPALRRFARRLDTRHALPVEWVDETLTSWEAERTLAHSRARRQRTRSDVDRMAACIILTSWFARQAAVTAGAST